MCASGTGRFIADSRFSDQPLPRAYTRWRRPRVRQGGGVGAKVPDAAAIGQYQAQVDIPAAIDGAKNAAAEFNGLRGEYLAGLALCFEIMWELAMAILGNGPPVPYARCVTNCTRCRGANIQFLPIHEAWFSGSMNYLGRARRPGGEPEYEAAYEITASLDISLPEFMRLVSHEVVPGHVTTFADLQIFIGVGWPASVR